MGDEAGKADQLDGETDNQKEANTKTSEEMRDWSHNKLSFTKWSVLKMSEVIEITESELDSLIHKKVRKAMSNQSTATIEPLGGSLSNSLTSFNGIYVNRFREGSDSYYSNMPESLRAVRFLSAINRNDTKEIETLHRTSHVYDTDGNKVKFSEFPSEVRENHMNLVRKDLSTLTAGAGGVLVIPDYNQVLINNLYFPQDLMQQATVFYTDKGLDAYLPALTIGCSPAWVSETAVKPESDPTFQQMHWHMNTQAVVTKISNQLLETSDPKIATIIAQEHARSLVIDSNYCMFYGSGAGQPRGINFDIAAPEIVHCGPVFNAIDLKNLIYALRQDRRRGGWFYMNDNVLHAIDSWVDVNGRFLFEGGQDLVGPTGDTLMGYHVFSGTEEELPCNVGASGTGTDASDCCHVFFGNPKNYIWYIRHNIRIARTDSNEDDFLKNLSCFRSERAADGRCIFHTFSKLTGICAY